MDKPTLIKKIKAVESLTNNEKADLIQILTTTKKYGLVWEDKPENVEKEMLTMLPVLMEVPARSVIAKDLIPAAGISESTEQNPVLPDESESTKELSISAFSGEVQTAAPNHILIEGDNLHSLTALTFTHEGKIDLMYFDPPYNTGNKDFKYNDNYVDKEDSYRHSKWLSFMHKRLLIAKRLLSEKGVIFISIDDNEQAQLKLLCNEIFLEENFISSFIWRTDGNFDNQAQVKNCHEYILCYSKNANSFKVSPVIDPNVTEFSKLFKDNIQNTIVKNGPKNPISEVKIPSGFPTLFRSGSIAKRNNKYPHYLEDVLVDEFKTCNETTVKSGWSSRTLLDLFIKNKFYPVIDSKNQLTEFKISDTGSIEAIKVRADQSHVISVLMNFGNTQNNSNRLAEMGIKFSYPKPQTLIEYIISIIPNKQGVILDIFAGSGTTLQATIDLNAEDGGKRQGILATNNENNICEEVTYERNKRVIQGYTNTKGVHVPGLRNNNLRYYKTCFVPSAKTEVNRRLLTTASTELLRIKEDCYNDITSSNGFNPKQCSVCTNGLGKYLVIVYHSRKQHEVISQLCKFIESIPDLAEKVRVYAFSAETEVLLEDFYPVAKKINAVPLPDAIYNAYRAIFKTLKLEKKTYIISSPEAELAIDNNGSASENQPESSELNEEV